MKKVIFLLFLVLGCSVTDSYNFFYEIITDSPQTLNITYWLDGEYHDQEIYTPWISATETTADESYFDITIDYSSVHGVINLYVNNSLWKTKEFYSGYDIKFEGTVEKPY